jgi:hypothetical protein
MSKTLTANLILLFFLNLVDAFATHYWVINGIAIEKNPLMGILFDFSPVVFLFLKIFIGSLCIWFLIHRKKTTIIKFLIFPTLIVYLYVTVMHYHIALKVF